MALTLPRLHRRWLSRSRPWNSFLSTSPSSVLLLSIRHLHHRSIRASDALVSPRSPPFFDAFGSVAISPCPSLQFPPSLAVRHLNTDSSEATSLESEPTSLESEPTRLSRDISDEYNEEVEPIDLWEEEDEVTEPKIGDGGDGGGVVLLNCPWGEKALSIAHDVLLQLGDDMELYAFRTSHRGYIYVRLDKLSNLYGSPSMEEIEDFSCKYKRKIDEAGATGEIPDDLALEVSSPGAERLLRVPDDMHRFKDLPMRVTYVDDMEAKCQEKNGVFFLESIETASGCCVWRLADVKENRDPSAKGRPLSRKQRDWRLKLPYEMFKKVTLFLDH